MSYRSSGIGDLLIARFRALERRSSPVLRGLLLSVPLWLSPGPVGVSAQVRRTEDPHPRTIKVFSQDGRWLRTIGREGSGPGESRAAWFLHVPDPQWTDAFEPGEDPYGRPRERVRDLNRYFDTVLEVIDPTRETVVASRRGTVNVCRYGNRPTFGPRRAQFWAASLPFFR